MPLTSEGNAVLASMKRTYGDQKGERVFYASINKGKPGSGKWEGKKKRSPQRRAIEEMLKEA